METRLKNRRSFWLETVNFPKTPITEIEEETAKQKIEELPNEITANEEKIMAESESNVLWVKVNKIWFTEEVSGQLFSILTTFVIPYDCSHAWLLVGTESGTIFCMQFAKVDGDSSRREILISAHETEEEANKAGMVGVGDRFCEGRKKEKVLPDTKLKDILTYIDNFNSNYSLLSNNCQSLAYKAYGAFAVGMDKQWDYSKPGWTRQKDGSVTLVCNMM